MLKEAPTVTLTARKDRDYYMLLQQTKMVYDQLLRDKYCKLVDALLKKKRSLDEHCAQVEHEMGRDKALEYGVKAQEVINQMTRSSEEELAGLHQDYQHKMNTMHMQLEGKMA